MRITSLLFFCLISSFVRGQANGYHWVKSFGDTISTLISVVTTDAQGNVYTTGNFQTTIDFDPGAGVYTLTPPGAAAAYVTKFSPNGGLIWARHFGPANGNPGMNGQALSIDPNGNLLICGTFNGVCDLDPGTGVATFTNNNLGSFVLKLDTAGNFIWANSAEYSLPRAINTDTAGNVYITGAYSGTVDFDPGSQVFTLTAGSNGDIFVQKLNSNGSFQWAQGIGGSGIDGGNAICAYEGFVYVGGAFQLTADFNSGSGTSSMTATGFDGYILKLSDAGIFHWAKQFGGSLLDQVSSITADKTGIYSTGNFNGSCDFDPSGLSYVLTSLGQGDAFITKLDTAGNLVWAKQMLGFGNDWGNSIALDNSKNVITTVVFSSTIDVDPGTSSIWVPASGVLSSFVSKLDNSGNYIDALVLKNNKSVNIRNAVTDPFNNIYVAGHFKGLMDFDPSPGLNNLSWADGQVFVAKFCQGVQPTVSASGTTSFCAGKNVQLTSTAASSYSWTTGATTQTISAVQSGTYSVRGFSANGCAVSSTPIVITVYPSPLITVAGGTICSGSSFTPLPTGAVSYTYINGGALVTPTVNTTYSLVGTSSLGCVSLNTVTFNVQPLPLPTLAVTGGTICVGSTFTLSPSGASTFSFTNGGPVVSPVSTTSYSISGSYSSGCKSASMAIATIAVFPLPTLSVNGTQTVCKGSSATYSAGGASSFSWNAVIQSPTINILPLASTVLTLSGINTAGCISILQFSVTVDSLCSDVWPGDANSDGIVSTSDVLELGLAYASSGNTRNPGGNSYVSQYCANWSGNITTGKNKCHADCNGDGIVDQNDTLAIHFNLTQTHPFKGSQLAGNDIRLLVNNGTLIAGQWNKADIYLGDSANILHVYGTNFDLNFDKTLIESDQAFLNFVPSFLKQTNQTIDFRKPDFSAGKIYAATVRTDYIDAIGAGKIGEFHFKLKDGTENQYLALGISKSGRIDNKGNIINTNDHNILIKIRMDDVGIVKNTDMLKFEIVPNPASTDIVIQGINKKFAWYTIVDLSGRVLKNGDFTAPEIEIADLANGIYLVTIKSSNTLITKKLVVSR